MYCKRRGAVGSGRLITHPAAFPVYRPPEGPLNLTTNYPRVPISNHDINNPISSARRGNFLSTTRSRPHIPFPSRQTTESELQSLLDFATVYTITHVPARSIRTRDTSPSTIIIMAGFFKIDQTKNVKSRDYRGSSSFATFLIVGREFFHAHSLLPTRIYMEAKAFH